MSGLITSILQRDVPVAKSVKIAPGKTDSDRRALETVIRLGPLAKAGKLNRKGLRELRYAFKRCRERGLIYEEG
jgi:hypothetical protein